MQQVRETKHVLSPAFLDHFPGRLLNLHPAQPGQFAGTHAIQRAYQAFQQGEFDLVGTIVGVVDRRQIVDGSTIQPGDAVIGLASSGLHTNGYSLARRVFKGWDLSAELPELGRPLGEALLAPHRCYLADIQRLQQAGIAIKGLAHITGGGLFDNPPRILPDGVAIHLRRGSWPIPPLFQLIQRAGQIDPQEMAHVFNLGLGMLVVAPAHQAAPALRTLGEGWLVGEVVTGHQECILTDGQPDP